MPIHNTQPERAWAKFWDEFVQYYGIVLNYATFLETSADPVDYRSVRTFYGQVAGLLARTEKVLADHGGWIALNHPTEHVQLQDFLVPAVEIRDTLKGRMDAVLGGLSQAELLATMWYETAATPTLTQAQRDALAMFIRDRLG